MRGSYTIIVTGSVDVAGQSAARRLRIIECGIPITVLSRHKGLSPEKAGHEKTYCSHNRAGYHNKIANFFIILFRDINPNISFSVKKVFAIFDFCLYTYRKL